ncbi:hypothetical protein EJ06DRAFT_377098 [Trichodelitschia bisporula]|uniref:Uncharacterized protein n=1 Tax=Trichodelitschia bisporula TaxID=703511 RepID=A0A6G1HZ63_9PEZI|nr:hypothetical protein EJ06DRAFT_377098 [Trichodelitschia bisporula]
MCAMYAMYIRTWVANGRGRATFLCSVVAMPRHFVITARSLLSPAFISLFSTNPPRAALTGSLPPCPQPATPTSPTPPRTAKPQSPPTHPRITGLFFTHPLPRLCFRAASPSYFLSLSVALRLQTRSSCVAAQADPPPPPPPPPPPHLSLFLHLSSPLSPTSRHTTPQHSIVASHCRI